MKKYLIIFLNLFLITSLFAEEDVTDWTNYSSKWYFSEIKSEGSSNTDFNNEDYLLINDNNTFEYTISKKNLFAKGTYSWNLVNSSLIFNYSLPSDTAREYIIDYNEDKLILYENNVNFIFSKNPIITKNESTLISKLFRGLIGLISLILIAFIFSRNKKNINWALVVKGLLIQLLLAILILKVPFVQNIFEWVSSIFVTVLQFSKQGALFLFGETLVKSNEYIKYQIYNLPK